VETKTPTQAIHSDILRPKYFAVNPAVDEEMKAPKIIREEMSCCRSGLMFQPSGVDGALCPKIYNMLCQRSQPWSKYAHLEEANHRLQAANDSEIETILKRAQRNEGNNEQSFPMLLHAHSLFLIQRHDVSRLAASILWIGAVSTQTHVLLKKRVSADYKILDATT
jgi:hypothetical protein